MGLFMLATEATGPMPTISDTDLDMNSAFWSKEAQNMTVPMEWPT